jgi:hypothetical protein
VKTNLKWFSWSRASPTELGTWPESLVASVAVASVLIGVKSMVTKSMQILERNMGLAGFEMKDWTRLATLNAKVPEPNKVFGTIKKGE